MSQSKPIRNQIRDDELNEFFDTHEQDFSSKPWQRDDWDTKRSEILADNCQWCGATEDLAIHHKDERPEWWEVWDNARDDLFENSDYYTSQKYDNADEVCPRCSKKGFYHRSTMEPAYRCQQCDHEFDEPGERPVPDHNHDAYWEDMNTFVKEQRSKITSEFETRYQDHWDAYLNLENTVTICKPCHFAWHENNQRICTRCTDNYTEYRRDYQDYVCWDCVVNDKGLEQCPKCDDNWYNPSHNGLCKNCRIDLEGMCPECGEWISTTNNTVVSHLIETHDWEPALAQRAAGPQSTPSQSDNARNHTGIVCAECDKTLQSENQLISHLVDQHNWSRIDARKSIHQN